MQGQLLYELTAMVNRAWYAYQTLFRDIPFWDPYGAMTSIVLSFALMAWLIKRVMG